MNKERVAKILAYLEETGETQASLAHSANVSPTVINQILKDTYKGDSESNITKMLDVINGRKEKASIQFQVPEFIKTSIAKKIVNALRRSTNIAVPRILVLHGASGIGKTKTAQEFLKKDSTTTLIEIRPDFTIKAVLQTIAQEIGTSPTGANFDITNRIIAKLKYSNRMIIFDEAEYLSARSLDIIRRIHDHAQIPIVLMGMPHLYQNIVSLRKGYEQIANRMVSYHLGKPDKKDLEEIVEACVLNINKSVCDALIECSKGTIRTLILLMQDLVNHSAITGQPFSADDVRAYSASMH